MKGCITVYYQYTTFPPDTKITLYQTQAFLSENFKRWREFQLTEPWSAEILAKLVEGAQKYNTLFFP